MYSMIRPLLFQLDPERAHTWALSALDCLPQCCFPTTQGTPVRVMGLDFPHPVGLAAGLDKNGDHLDALAKLGFSFIELGTVTPKPQEGNPKPRLFRLPKASALINRMGFNNKGVDALVCQVKKSHFKGILGINIGKNKETPIPLAAEDYLYCLKAVYPYASYVTVNISSPNTPDLRQLQQGDFFSNLLAQLQTEQKRLADCFQRHVPLVIKVSPDESDETLKQMSEVILNYGVEGIVASNTTCSREGVETLASANEQGGLSGSPLALASTRCLRTLKAYVGNSVTLIGVGGIDSPDRAQEKISAGASLIQVYTGLIYKGPGLVRELIECLGRAS